MHCAAVQNRVLCKRKGCRKNTFVYLYLLFALIVDCVLQVDALLDTIYHSQNQHSFPITVCEKSFGYEIISGTFDNVNIALETEVRM